MPVTPTYPGVYIEEVPNGARTIIGVATSIAAFLGRAQRGPINEPATINNYDDFLSTFGELLVKYPLAYAVRDFFLNGGQQAIVVRLHKNSKPSKNTDLKLEAATPGEWGDKLTYTVDYKGITDEVAQRYGLNKGDLFNMTVYDNPPGGRVERFLNVSTKDAATFRRLECVLKSESNLVRVQKKTDGRPDLVSNTPSESMPQEDPASDKADVGKFKKFKNGKDGDDLSEADDVIGDRHEKTGLYALEKADLFNLLCIPPDKRGGDTPTKVYQTAMKYCADRRAMLIVDSPAAWGVNKEKAAATARDNLSGLSLTGNESRNAALFFPHVMQSDPQSGGQLDTFVPCGIVAGIMARTDVNRGVWKAPAGADATIIGIQALQANLTDEENGMLNPLGINCLRSFPVTGHVVWGSRTLRGADQLADEYKYVPVRRLALYIEETLYRATKWVVFEPNDEPLWAQIRLNIGAFMHGLFRQGAFAGTTPRDAYFVKCDTETTTQDDVNKGIVNIVVGFAPLKPAEFLIIKIQQMAGQVPT